MSDHSIAAFNWEELLTSVAAGDAVKTMIRENPGKTNPFKGLQSYEEGDENIFLCRDDSSEKVFRLVRHNFLTLVAGQRGMGKTSLFNADVFPRLEHHGLPV